MACAMRDATWPTTLISIVKHGEGRIAVVIGCLELGAPECPGNIPLAERLTNPRCEDEIVSASAGFPPMTHEHLGERSRNRHRPS